MNRHPYWLPLALYRWLEADPRRWWYSLPAIALLALAGILTRGLK